MTIGKLIEAGLVCECVTWARADFDPTGQITTHRRSCPRFKEGLIDVWRVESEGASYVTNAEPTEIEGATVTLERMHREIFDNLPEFAGS